MRAILFLFATAALWAQQQTPALPTTTTDPNADKGSLEGVVVDQVTGAPVKKATVQLAPMQAGSQTTVGTDASGAWAVRELPAGRYRVSASHPAYGASGRTGPAYSIVSVSAGEAKKGVVVKLNPPASLSGKIVDEDGDPISGCSVRAFAPSRQGGKLKLSPAGGGNVDASGEYTIAALPAGRYYVFAQCVTPPLEPQPLQKRNPDAAEPMDTYETLYYPGVSDASGAAPVALQAGVETKAIDFRLRKVQSYTVTGALSGIDADTQGRMIRIQLIPADSSVSAAGAQNLGGAARGGRFSIPRVRPGAYILVAQSMTAGRGSGGKQFAGRMPVTVGNRPPDPVTVMLSPIADLPGTLSIDGSDLANADAAATANATPSAATTQTQQSASSNSSQAATPQNPTQNIRISFTSDEQMGMRGNPATQVQPDGTFTATGLAPGRWTVKVAGGVSAYVKSVRLGDQESSGAQFEVPQGATGPLLIALSTKVGSLNGAVQADNPEDVATVTVIATPVGDLQDDRTQWRTAQTDAQGTFSISNLIPGPYKLYAVAQSGTSPDPDLLRALESQAESVTLEPGGTATRNLHLITAEQLARAQ